MLDKLPNPCYGAPRKEIKIMNANEDFGLINVEELHQFKGEPHDANLTLEDYMDIFLEEFN